MEWHSNALDPMNAEAYCWAVDVTIYTDPAAQRRGIGRALYQRLQQTRVLCRVRRYRPTQCRRHRYS